jgi:hypothetical protein
MRLLLVLAVLCFAVVGGVASASRPASEPEPIAPSAALGVPEHCGRAALGLCKRRRTYLLCANARATARHRAFAPRACNTLGPRQPFADAVNLAKLRWNRWGRATATARGVDRGFRKDDKAVAVTVRASRRAVGCHGDWVYTRLRVHSRYGNDYVRQPTACP